MSTDRKTIDWYNKHAAEYAEHVRNPESSPYHSLYEKPAMYSLIPKLNGVRVLCLGSGTGEEAQYFKKAGAKESIGIDISKNQIQIASKSYPDCKFLVMDMEKLDFQNNSFDFAYSSLAFHYVESWTAILEETYRVLKPGSYFIFSCGHPISTSMQESENESEKFYQLTITKDKRTDDANIVGDYLTHRPVVQGDWDVTNWHKPIGEMCQEILQSGFEIVEVVEPKPLEEMQKVAPFDYKKLSKIPEFLIFKLKKS